MRLENILSDQTLPSCSCQLLSFVCSFSRSDICGRKLKSLLHSEEKTKTKVNLAQHSNRQLLEGSCSLWRPRKPLAAPPVTAAKGQNVGLMDGGPWAAPGTPRGSWAGSCWAPGSHCQEKLWIFCNGKAKCGNCWGWMFSWADCLGAKRGAGEELL